MMSYRTLLLALSVFLSLSLMSQNDGQSVLLISLQKENIHANANMENYLSSVGISDKQIKNRVMAEAQQTLQEVSERNGVQLKSMKDQVALLSSEFVKLQKQDAIDKTPGDREHNFFDKLLNIFRKSPPSHYMSAEFSADKVNRITTNLEQQKSQYAIILHQYEMNRSICGAAELIVHFTVIDREGEIVLGAQQIYYIDISKSMKPALIPHIIESGFSDTYQIIFDKLF
ncbi:MAG: hypothetical protein R6T91_06635 [Bacteroidales bacterium]